MYVSYEGVPSGTDTECCRTDEARSPSVQVCRLQTAEASPLLLLSLSGHSYCSLVTHTFPPFPPFCTVCLSKTGQQQGIASLSSDLFPLLLLARKPGAYNILWTRSTLPLPFVGCISLADSYSPARPAEEQSTPATKKQCVAGFLSYPRSSNRFERLQSIQPPFSAFAHCCSLNYSGLAFAPTSIQLFATRFLRQANNSLHSPEPVRSSAHNSKE
ncbi:hypothetical protein VTL71DRAFT_15467 [Oculimacula yallundae]|uniref:Uncharacterized protein n=1 Tax=Oculimacula yallundae TaxID=86028 RepID=A0ABR4CGP5_9HELO